MTPTHVVQLFSVQVEAQAEDSHGSLLLSW